MIKGFNLYCGKSFEDMVALCNYTMGSDVFTALEINYPYENPSLGNEQIENYLKALREITHMYHPCLTLHPPLDLDMAYPNRAIRRAMIDQYKRVLEFAGGIGVELIAMHPGTMCQQGFSGHPEFPLRDYIAKKQEQIFADTVEAMSELADFCNGSGIVLAVENLIYDYDITSNPQKMNRLIAAINKPNVKSLLDIGHSYLLGTAPDIFLSELLECPVHFHIHDNNGSADQHMYPGLGQIDFAAFFTTLLTQDYYGVLMLETKNDNPEELLATADYLDRKIAEASIQILNGSPV
ncbi:MAG: sugar phosphate isomerase/epimerase [Candidatus Latescibacteria bacterium]|nr:sugar phosphate isomerase/epimerase [Candidatus Latescibacterota bacterium]